MPKGKKGYQTGKYVGEKSWNWRGGKIEVICQYEKCGKPFEVYPCEIKNIGGKYHSRKCYYLSKKGMPSKLKGTKLTTDHCRKLSEAHIGKSNNWEGRKHSEKSKIKMSEWHKNKEFSKEHLQNMSEAHIKYMASGKHKFKDTSIEIAIEKELKRVNLNYQKQVAICKVGIVDFFLPEYDIIIECDGDYFHNLPDHKQRDATKDLVWMFNNYKVFRFWEHEINKSPKRCINKVLRYIKSYKVNSRIAI